MTYGGLEREVILFLLGFLLVISIFKWFLTLFPKLPRILWFRLMDRTPNLNLLNGFIWLNGLAVQPMKIAQLGLRNKAHYLK